VSNPPLSRRRVFRHAIRELWPEPVFTWLEWCRHVSSPAVLSANAVLPFFNGLQFVAQRTVIAAFETAFLALTFAGFHQVFQTTRPLNRLLTAFRASFVPLHAQLIFSLARNSQRCELVFNAFSHFIPFPTGKNISRNNLYFTFRPMSPQIVRLSNFLAEKGQKSRLLGYPAED